MKLLQFYQRIYDTMVSLNCANAEVPDMYIIFNPENNTAKIRDIDPDVAFYQKNIDTCGEDTIILKAIEEMAELTQQLAKVLDGQGDLADVAEEMADVKITLEQTKMIMARRSVGFGMLMSKIKKAKIKRQEERINGKE